MYNQEYKVLSLIEKKHWWFNYLHSNVKDLLRIEAKSKNKKLDIFDVGCGTGGLLLKLSRDPWINSLEGCEPNTYGFDHTRKLGINVLNCSIEDMQKTNSNYDAAICMDVLYHKNVMPDVCMNSIFRLLSPGGLLLLNVAAMPCLKRTHDERVMGVRRYYLAQLRDLVISAGFEVESLYYWNSLLAPILWIQARFENRSIFMKSFNQKRVSDLELPPRLINKILFQILQLETIIRDYFSFPFGSSLFLVARKAK